MCKRKRGHVFFICHKTCRKTETENETEGPKATFRIIFFPTSFSSIFLISHRQSYFSLSVFTKSTADQKIIGSDSLFVADRMNNKRQGSDFWRVFSESEIKRGFVLPPPSRFCSKTFNALMLCQRMRQVQTNVNLS